MHIRWVKYLPPESDSPRQRAAPGYPVTVALNKPTPIFGENGLPTPQPRRPRRFADDSTPVRIPVHYSYAEAFGDAQVVYCFPVAKLVRLSTGGACRVESLAAGMKFKLEGGNLATVNRVDPPKLWPAQRPIPDLHGNVTSRVVGTVRHRGAIVLDITIGQKILTATPEHLFWSATRRQWIPARALKPGEVLLGRSGATVPVGRIGSPRKLLVDLFNLEVEITHAYFVGNPAILVHNGYDCIQLPAWEQELVDAEGLTVKAPSEIGAAGAELHHIATIYEGEGMWATKFQELFDQAGYSLEDDINKVMVDGHFGPHPELYHELVYKALSDATEGLSGPAFRTEFDTQMEILRGRVTDVDDILNALITF